jgi:plastocyanin
MLKPATPTGVTGLTPSTVTVPAGAAVVFRSADQDLHAAVSSTDHWRTSALKGPNGREAQRFGVAGTYSNMVENTTGAVVVQ